MREDTVVTKVYKFDELSDEAKAVAVERLSGLNIHDEWWESTYEDAARIGLKIEEFDLGQCSYVRGPWTEDAEAVAGLIQEHHGETCETHKDATTFLAAVETAKTAFEGRPGYDPDYEEFDEIHIWDISREFERTICEDYRIMLQKEYEYLTSEEQIIEAIRSNAYEFTADGVQY